MNDKIKQALESTLADGEQVLWEGETQPGFRMENVVNIQIRKCR